MPCHALYPAVWLGSNKQFWETRRMINYLFGVTPIHLYGVCCLIQEIHLILVLRFVAGFVSVLLRDLQFWVSYKFRHVSSYCSSPSHFWVLASKPQRVVRMDLHVRAEARRFLLLFLLTYNPIRYLIKLYIVSDCSSLPVDGFPPIQNDNEWS